MNRLPKFRSVLTHAKAMRTGQTPSEVKLWKELRGRQFAGFKFRRQQPIGPYIVDFCCFEAKLLIELDGASHKSRDTVLYDRQRTEYLQSLGLRELRFWNADVDDRLEATLSAIRRALTPGP